MTLRELLKQRGIKQTIVAEALGIKPGNLCRYDDLSKRSIREIKIISKATGISLDDLMVLHDPLDLQHLLDFESKNEGIADMSLSLTDIVSENEKQNKRLTKSLDLAYKEIDRLNAEIDSLKTENQNLKNQLNNKG